MTQAFAHAARQRVIVELSEPASTARMPPEPERPSTTAGSGAPGRRTALAARKAAVLADLAGVAGEPARVLHELRPFRLLALEVGPSHVARLAKLPGVARVRADRQLEAQLQSSLPHVEAPAFHQSHARGSGTAVAVLDTPVRFGHPAFGSCSAPGVPGCRVRLQLNFGPSTLEEVMEREDQLQIGSHGSNVAGIVLGVAPETDIISLNVFHRDPVTGNVVANLSDSLAAMAWVADGASDHGIVAVNSSLGTYRSDAGACNDSANFDPIRVLHRDHGVLTVTVAGNDALQNAVRDPGCVSSAVTVGAVFDHAAPWYGDAYCSQNQPLAGQLVCFSNRSGLVDLVAPGVDVDAGGYGMTGTSQAAPHVAGAIAAWQSHYLAEDGAFRSAAWMQRNLLASSSSPLSHFDGRRFSELELEQGVGWDYAHAFGWWYEELPDNVIPSGGSALEESLSIAGQNGTVAAAYLYLEVVHPAPEHVRMTLTSPNGQSATTTLPGGQASYTGLVGHTTQPGVLAALAGAPANGTWTLSLVDEQGAHVGHYLQAALYLLRQGPADQPPVSPGEPASSAQASGGGCGCSAPAEPGRTASVWLLAVGAALALLRRRAGQPSDCA